MYEFKASRDHEAVKTVFARILEHFCQILASRGMTGQQLKKKARGLAKTQLKKYKS